MIARELTREAIDNPEIPAGAEFVEWCMKARWIKGKKGLRPFSFVDHEYLRQIYMDRHRYIVLEKAAQMGAPLAVDTPIPTPTGWTTMGELQIGDLVLSEQLVSCRVAWVSPFYFGHPCFKITWQDGTSVVCDHQHKWPVINDNGLRCIMHTDDMYQLSASGAHFASEIYRPNDTSLNAIVSITPTASVAVRCIAVENPTHLYLCTTGMIPTHNTEYALSRVLYYCDTIGRFRAIYFFPTDGDVQDFSGERVEAALLDSPYLKTRCRGIKNVGVKRVGVGIIYFRGMFSKNRAKSVPADMVVFDELDEAKAANKAQAKERLSHSNFGYVIELSTPTLPNRGIDIEYQQSDQCFWHVACGCHEGIVLEKEFPNCIGVASDGEAYLRCPKCGKDHLDPNIPAVVGEYTGWIPDRPELSKQRRGYHITQLFSGIFTPSSIWYEYEHTNDIAEFHNSKLGFPYAGDRMPLTDRIVEDASADTVPMDMGLTELARQYRKVYYGIDVGPHEWYIWIHDKSPNNGNRRLLWAEVIRNIDTNNDPKKRALEIVNSFEQPVGIIDANPERHEARDFCRYAKGRTGRGQAFMIFYTEGGTDKVKTHEEEGQTFRVMVVNAHRTETLDDFVDSIKAAADGRGNAMYLMHPQHPVSKEISLHLCSLAKVKKNQTVNSETGRQSIGYVEYVYVESSADHFAHAGNYATIAESAEEPEAMLGFM